MLLPPLYPYGALRRLRAPVSELVWESKLGSLSLLFDMQPQMVKTGYKYLDSINSPEDLKKIPAKELPVLAGEIRDFMVSELSVNPGHLGSSLGAVELAIALHYVFDTPEDKVVWDVGHQAYAHKILTGRREQFHTNRKLGGISGFPKMSESEYDAFGAGHASVSISAALGMAQANKLKGMDEDVIAVIGDGAMTGGLAYEGLNNAGASNADILVILNDNDMAISPNVGAMKEYLMRITTSKRYNRIKNNIWNATSRVPWLRHGLQHMGNIIKQGIFRRSNLFESLNFRYFGPVDGHDIKSLIRVLGDLKRLQGPRILHIVTSKGKGYAPAEQDPPVWHAPGCFDPRTGELSDKPCSDKPAKYQDVFGYTLLELARMDDRVVGVTPAMLTGSSMDILMKEMPERCFDVGIAEGHAVTFSAGLAAAGLRPFCNIYSTFMQRAYDNVIHDVALQGLPVIMCLDRAGIVGEDGTTHQGAFDLAFLRSVPGIVVAAPLNETELRDMMYTALCSDVPFAIRYPRGRGAGADWSGAFHGQEIGKGQILDEGSDIAVITIGTVGNMAAEAIARAKVEGISVAHIDLRYAKPLDEELLHYAGNKFNRIITVEDGVISGGIGSAVMEFFSDNGYDVNIRRMGIGDFFVQHGTPAELYHLCGYDAEAIYEAIREISLSGL